MQYEDMLSDLEEEIIEYKNALLDADRRNDKDEVERLEKKLKGLIKKRKKLYDDYLGLE